MQGLDREPTDSILIRAPHPTGHYLIYATLDPIEYLATTGMPMRELQNSLPNDLEHIVYLAKNINAPQPNYIMPRAAHSEYAEATAEEYLLIFANQAVRNQKFFKPQPYRGHSLARYIKDVYVTELARSHEDGIKANITAARRAFFHRFVRTDCAQLTADLCMAIERRDWQTSNHSVRQFDLMKLQNL